VSSAQSSSGRVLDAIDDHAEPEIERRADALVRHVHAEAVALMRPRKMMARDSDRLRPTRLALIEGAKLEHGGAR
jgi:hypothetical protein